MREWLQALSSICTILSFPLLSRHVVVEVFHYYLRRFVHKRPLDNHKQISGYIAERRVPELTGATRIRQCLPEPVPRCHGVFLFVLQYNHRGDYCRTAPIFPKKHDLRRLGPDCLLAVRSFLPVLLEQQLWSHCAKKTGLSDGTTDGQQEMWCAFSTFQIAFDEWLRRHSILPHVQSSNSKRNPGSSTRYQDTIFTHTPQSSKTSGTVPVYQWCLVPVCQFGHRCKNRLVYRFMYKRSLYLNPERYVYINTDVCTRRLPFWLTLSGCQRQA